MVSRIKKIHQFDFHKHIEGNNKDEIMSEIYMMNHGFVKQENCDPNVVFICPMSSTNKDLVTRRFMEKSFLHSVVQKLLKKRNKVYLVGIEKDIEEYGYLQNCEWINTNYIMRSHNDKEDINMKKFMQMVANAKFVISAPTFFPIMSSMLSVPTLTLHRYNKNNIPMTSSSKDNFGVHFYNTKWFKTLKMYRCQEILKYLERI